MVTLVSALLLFNSGNRHWAYALIRYDLSKFLLLSKVRTNACAIICIEEMPIL
jgi:hypothetical protein